MTEITPIPPQRAACSIELPIPPTANNLFKTVQVYSKKSQKMVQRRAPSGKYEEWKLDAIKRICASGYRKAITRFPVRIVITIYSGSGFPASRDIAGCEKAVTDALVAAGMIPDDKVKYVASNTQQYIVREKSKEPAQCFVTVFQAPEEVS